MQIKSLKAKKVMGEIYREIIYRFEYILKVTNSISQSKGKHIGLNTLS